MAGFQNIDDIADLFEEAWRKGTARIEDFLQMAPASLEADLFTELLRVECQILNQRGQTPPWAGYHYRFPRFITTVDEIRKACEPATGIARHDVDVYDTRAPLRYSDYEIGELRGAGAMGKVYKALQKHLNRHVAVKVIENVGNAESANRFLREAEACARLNHPNLVSIHGVGRVPNGGYFLAMELVPGHDLAEEIRNGPVPIERARSIAETVARAIEFAHNGGVVHRDLKPENIICGENNTIKVVDFGLAKILGEDHTLLTTSSQILGTPAYMAPEQIDRERGDIGPAADIYAIGGILYAMLAGHRPYSGDIYQIFEKVLSDEQPESLRVSRSDIPFELEAICVKCLRKNAVDRYASAAELADALREPGLASLCTSREAFTLQTESSNLTLLDELVLLSRDDETGKRLAADGITVFGSLGYFSKALAAASIAELLFCGRIALQKDTVRVLSSQATGDETLDRFLAFLSRNSTSIVDAVGREEEYVTEYEDEILFRLVDRGILRKEITYRFLIFKKVLYPTRDAQPKIALVRRLFEVFGSPGGRIPWRISMLLAILHETDNWALVAPLACGRPDKARSDQLFGSKDESIAVISKAVAAAISRARSRGDDAPNWVG